MLYTNDILKIVSYQNCNSNTLFRKKQIRYKELKKVIIINFNDNYNTWTITAVKIYNYNKKFILYISLIL